MTSQSLSSASPIDLNNSPDGQGSLFGVSVAGAGDGFADIVVEAFGLSATQQPIGFAGAQSSGHRRYQR
jgi:hypothetical protein